MNLETGSSSWDCHGASVISAGCPVLDVHLLTELGEVVKVHDGVESNVVASNDIGFYTKHFVSPPTIVYNLHSCVDVCLWSSSYFRCCPHQINHGPALRPFTPVLFPKEKFFVSCWCCLRTIALLVSFTLIIYSSYPLCDSTVNVVNWKPGLGEHREDACATLVFTPWNHNIGLKTMFASGNSNSHLNMWLAAAAVRRNIEV